MSNATPPPSREPSDGESEDRAGQILEQTNEQKEPGSTDVVSDPIAADEQEQLSAQGDRPKPKSGRSRRSTRIKKNNRLADWLERRFCVPEFAGGMLLCLAAFFFAAATNTLAGWLYVISGVSFALLLIGAVMPAKIIKEIEVVRSPLEPASAGDMATIELKFANLSKAKKELLRLRDLMPPGLADRECQETIIELLPPGKLTDRFQHHAFTWSYSFIARRRGIYTLSEVQIVTASPLGLFRSRRSHFAKQRLVVYPTVLPLKQCPIVDQLGTDDSPRQYNQEFNYKNATEGITRALRPYRWGDPIRLVHWRTSARFGDLRIRELEVTLGGQDLAIALDLEPGWQEWEFERAVVAAASLFFYAQGMGLKPQLWTATDGLITQVRAVLETLAQVQVLTPDPSDTKNTTPELATRPDLPLVWLSHRAASLADLPAGSRWLLWQNDESAVSKISNPGNHPGLAIATISGSPDQSFRALQTQLQAPLKHATAAI
ncbi:protein of unknown function DUF58 [Thalassoporum mexicanum PCC 7367]|uniref:DUF58 domain-containing protein n=1 Tax=Thalassoporum mexicanum TaxID=3457544 RepID=UPI00029F9E38|nr:DUF58 domain-containing protein [Pseudanabaena sp. PCC 7367]AFY71087.1 protein of unknown function DUF58 [Pseudanabaena sp. PCC 7367]